MRYILLFVSFIAVSLALLPSQALAYPGCEYRDIIIGGQMWASCNVSAKGIGSPERSGWYFADDVLPRFTADNGLGSYLDPVKNTRSMIARMQSPCLSGYRLPTRGEWETALSYARMNGTTLGDLLNLPYNGGYRAFRDSEGDIMVQEREDVYASYWSSSRDTLWGYESPIVLHIGAHRDGARMNGTDGIVTSRGYQFQYGDDGIKLVSGERTVLANIRCIRRF